MLNDVGHIISPTLRNISKIGYYAYNIHVDTLLSNIQSYYKLIENNSEMYFAACSQEQKAIIREIQRDYYEMDEVKRRSVSFLHIFAFDPIYLQRVLCALNFFFVEYVEFDKEKMSFILYEKELKSEEEVKPVGYICGRNYEAVVDLILQRICMSKSDIDSDNVKVKNKITAKLLEKIKKGAKKKEKKADNKMQIPNIISSLATHSKSLNIINIWDITVYQLIDQFKKQQIEDTYSITASSVSAWGDKDNKFDGTMWLSLVNDE